VRTTGDRGKHDAVSNGALGCCTLRRMDRDVGP
jgi:hypothetical protein